MRPREADRILRESGYWFKRQGGSHRIYTNGHHHISISGSPQTNHRLPRFLRSEIRKGNRLKKEKEDANMPGMRKRYA